MSWDSSAGDTIEDKISQYPSSTDSNNNDNNQNYHEPEKENQLTSMPMLHDHAQTSIEDKVNRASPDMFSNNKSDEFSKGSCKTSLKKLQTTKEPKKVINQPVKPKKKGKSLLIKGNEPSNPSKNQNIDKIETTEKNSDNGSLPGIESTTTLLNINQIESSMHTPKYSCLSDSDDNDEVNSISRSSDNMKPLPKIDENNTTLNQTQNKAVEKRKSSTEELKTSVKKRLFSANNDQTSLEV